MLRVALFSCLVAVGACAATAAPSGPPPAPMFAPGAGAPGDCTGPAEASCMLDAAWQAAGLLPQDKQARLKPAFAETTRGIRDGALASRWQMRLGTAPPPQPAPDFARRQAEAAIAEYGWQGFLARAHRGEAPLNMGRPEILAAAVELAPDPDQRVYLIDIMFSLAGAPKPGTSGFISQDSFERASLGHVLTEQMMKDCNLVAFDRARGLTAAPESIRYELWRTRMTGGAGKLAPRIRQGDGSDDTTFVRHVLEGYGPVLRQGYCPG
ncbi:hypothetical protein BBF93_01395 [Hyphomonas sp. CACIAM 19H1]|nr:hypothetical protein BBF93_01395 [Hyphomonas sp. CACIAM 19H1]